MITDLTIFIENRPLRAFEVVSEAVVTPDELSAVVFDRKKDILCSHASFNF